MAIVETTRSITGGVDTHLDTHVVAALDPNGGVLGVAAFPATGSGYCSLSSWLGEFGTIGRIGVEGTGASGAGLARHLRSLGVEVIEVDRPNRQLRRAQGKSDTIDAIEAARAVLSGRATGVAKTADGNVEAMRALLIAKRSGREARITCLHQIRHLGFTAPDELRERFQRVSRGMLAAQAAALGPRPDSDAVIYATKLAMRSLGRRVLGIDEEIARLEVVLGELVTATTPGLLGLYGVGVDTAAIVCVAAGDNPQRVRSEAAWAQLCGVAPLEATSGKVTRRHRLNRGGNRQANHALWRIVFTRLGSDPRTRSYVARRLDGRDPRSSASSSATSPGRPTDTSRANGSAAAGLAQEQHDPAPAVCPSIDLPTRRCTPIRRRLGPIRARPHRVAHHWSASTAEAP